MWCGKTFVKIDRVQLRGLLLIATALLLYLLYKAWSLHVWTHTLEHP